MNSKSEQNYYESLEQPSKTRLKSGEIGEQAPLSHSGSPSHTLTWSAGKALPWSLHVERTLVEGE